MTERSSPTPCEETSQGDRHLLVEPLLENHAHATEGEGPLQDPSKKAPPTCLTFLPRSVQAVGRSAWDNGVLCMSIATVMYSLLWVTTKEISLLSISIFQASVYRTSFGLIMTALLCKLMGITPILGDRKMYGWLFLRGFVGGTAIGFVYSAFLFLPVGDVCALQLLSTVFVVLFAWVFGWEKTSAMSWLGAVTCTLGAILVSDPPLLHGGHEDWGLKRSLGIGVTLIGAALAGMAYALITRIGNLVHPMSMTIWFYAPSTLITLVPLGIGYPVPPVLSPTWKQGLLLMGSAVFGFVGQLLMTRSYQVCKATTGAALQTTTVVYSYILAYLFLGEGISYFAIGGTALIGVGLVAIAQGKRKAEKALEIAPIIENDPDNL